jgi:mannobiose 2-epimerase
MITSTAAKTDWKDQNTSIHLLEAFAELYTCWPDSLLKERLTEMLQLVRGTFTSEKGSLVQFMERNWVPVSFLDSSEAAREANSFLDHVSFGHDVEAAYLMLEASHVLGLEGDEVILSTAKKMVDHALANGWDEVNGGFFYEGYYPDPAGTITITDSAKQWWTEAEGLNALLLMSRLFPSEDNYYRAFRRQWHYIDTWLIDHKHGGWYPRGLDNRYGQAHAAKANNWTVNYHDSRALMNCIKMLRGESELTK